MKPAGFSLVELLVAAAVTGVVLAAAFGWLWNVAGLAGGTDDRVQAATVAAACARAVARDVEAAVAVTQPPVGRDAARSLALRHDRPGVAAEDVLVVWDPGRRVVWRNASGTYLADHVAAFELSYLLPDGRLIAGGDMEAVHWATVRGVRVRLSVTIGAVTQERALLVSLRPS